MYEHALAILLRSHSSAQSQILSTIDNLTTLLAGQGLWAERDSLQADVEAMAIRIAAEMAQDSIAAKSICSAQTLPLSFGESDDDNDSSEEELKSIEEDVADKGYYDRNDAEPEKSGDKSEITPLFSELKDSSLDSSNVASAISICVIS